VETPAGLMVALPPCETCRGEGVTGRTRTGYPQDPALRCPDCHPDVFALAVPCSYETATAPETGHTCDGYVHHGDYRVLDVLPIVNEEHGDGLPDHLCRRDDGRVTLVRDGSFVTPFLDLPAAVPGGVALVVERVDP
jgi:hypothetical protein